MTFPIYVLTALIVFVFPGLLAMAGVRAAFLFVPLFYYLGGADQYPGRAHGSRVDGASFGMEVLYLIGSLALLAGTLWWVSRRNQAVAASRAALR